MSIKMTLRQAIAAYQALDALPKIPNGKISYTLGYIGDKLEQHVRQFDKQRQKLTREMSEQDKEGKRVIPAGKVEAFSDALEDMLDVEIEISRDPVKLTDVLGGNPEVAPQIEPNVLRRLQLVIVE